MDLESRRALLTAAVGFQQLDWRGKPPLVAAALARWLDSWHGVGAVATGMTAQGFNLELKEYPGGWRANFYHVGTAHSVVLGSAYEPTSWKAVQRAAWRTLARSEA